jgi:hypothetical protein
LDEVVVVGYGTQKKVNVTGAVSMVDSKMWNKSTIAQQQFGNMAGFGLNLKLVLYLQSPCLTETLGFLNPPHRQAAGR